MGWMKEAAALLLLALAVPATLAVPAGAAGVNDDFDDGPEPDPLQAATCRVGPKAACAGVDLRHRVLKNVDMTGIDLRGANLARADLRHVNLRGANLAGANLEGADLSLAFLQGTNFSGADLRGANLEFARASTANFSGADLTAANLEMLKAEKARFVGATLVNANLQETKFTNANLRQADMDGALKRYTNFQGTLMEECRGCPQDWCGGMGAGSTGLGFPLRCGQPLLEFPDGNPTHGDVIVRQFMDGDKEKLFRDAGDGHGHLGQLPNQLGLDVFVELAGFEHDQGHGGILPQSGEDTMPSALNAGAGRFVTGPGARHARPRFGYASAG